MAHPSKSLQDSPQWYVQYINAAVDHQTNLYPADLNDLSLHSKDPLYADYFQQFLQGHIYHVLNREALAHKPRCQKLTSEMGLVFGTPSPLVHVVKPHQGLDHKYFDYLTSLYRLYDTNQSCHSYGLKYVRTSTYHNLMGQ
ncbi:hypothetical protein D3C80_600790 [compost metagenome]